METSIVFAVTQAAAAALELLVSNSQHTANGLQEMLAA
jgi:hypothetical protein